MPAVSKLLKASSVYVLLGFLAPAVNFLLLPVYAGILAPQDYAIIALATLVQAVLTPLVGLGVNGAFGRLYYDVSRNSVASKAMLTSSFVIFLGSLALLTVCAWLFGDFAFRTTFKNNVFTFRPYGYLVLATALFSNIQLLVLTWLRNAERLKQYALWSVVFFLCSAAGILVGVVGLRLGAFGSVCGRMVGLAVPSLIWIGGWLIRHPPVIRQYMLKRLLSYGLPLVPYLLLNVAFANVDKLFAERYFDLPTLGKYAFATQIAMAIDIFNNALTSAMYPPLFKSMRAEGSGGSNAEVGRILSMILIISFGITATMISVGAPLIRYLIHPRYHDALLVLPLLAMAYIPRVLWITWSMPMMYEKKVKALPLINGTALLVSIVNTLVFIPYLGIYTLPLSFFLAQSTMVAGAIIQSKRLRLDMRQHYRLSKEYIVGGILVISLITATFLYNASPHHLLYYLLILPIFLASLFVLLRSKLLALRGGYRPDKRVAGASSP